MSVYDVVVVGGRVAGASTAMLLARGGARVALLDRGDYGSDTLSTHALMRGAVLQLSRWGLLDRIVEAGTPAVRHTVFHYADAPSVPVEISVRHGFATLYAPRRTLLDRVLVDAAAEAGVDVHHRTKVTGMERSGGRVTGVRAQRADGTSLSLSAALTIGADGLRSRVAQQVGALERRRWRHGTASLYRHITNLPTDGYEWVYGPASTAGLIPTNGGQTCVFVTIAPSTLHALRPRGVEAAFDALLHRAAPILVDRIAAASAEATPIRGWGGHPGFVRRASGPGWALVGDAAYFKDPLTAHGITDALRDAELLAAAVLTAVDGGEREALASYEATRDRLSHSLADVTDRLAALDWNTSTVQPLLKELAASMTDEVDYLAALPRSTQSASSRS